jgi:thioredoxin-dependent peroxiredoxin
MQNKWLQCFVAVICTGATACQKEPAPTPTETVTQSAKPASTEAAKADTTAKEAAPSATAQPATAAGQPTTAAPSTVLEVGSDAPNVTFTLQDGKTVALSSLKGKQVAVYFYPKDDTPGCTVEAQGIRDQWEAFEKAGVEVYGVSRQDAASHTAFIEKHKLPFDLAVDTDGSLTQAFGVPVSGGQFAARHTFLIGADGKIKQIWRNVTPAEHAKQLLEAAGATPAASPAAPKAG